MEERDWRIQRVKAAMAAARLDGLLAYGPPHRRENVRYLTGAGLQSPLTFVHLPIDGEPVAFVDASADIMAIWSAGFVDDVRPLFELPSVARGRLGVAHVSLVPQAALAMLDGAVLVPATAMMERVRLVKSEWELQRLRCCARMCDEAWATLLHSLGPGIAEYELRERVEAALLAAGAEDNVMRIASGGDEVRRLSSPSARRVAIGDMVRTELTPQLEGYWTQICRTAVVGEPSRGQRDSFALLDEATAAGLEAVRPGVTVHEVAKAENDVLRRHGFGEYCSGKYSMVRGHGHGLDRNELPIVENCQTVLEENAVVNVHPNTFTPLAGFHVLGDPVVVKKDGPKPLLRTPRALDQV